MPQGVFTGPTEDIPPATITAFAGGVIGIAAAYGLPIPPGASDSILQLVTWGAPTVMAQDWWNRNQRRKDPQIVADVLRRNAELELRKAEKTAAREKKRTLYHAMQGWGAVAAVAVSLCALAVTLVFQLT